MKYTPPANLQRMIMKFLAQAEKVVEIQEKDPALLDDTEIQKLATSIWNLRHFSSELLQIERDESLRYDAAIVMNIVDQPMIIGEPHPKPIKLIDAADQANKQHESNCLREVIKSWSSHDVEKSLLMQDLKIIAYDLNV